MSSFRLEVTEWSWEWSSEPAFLQNFAHLNQKIKQTNTEGIILTIYVINIDHVISTSFFWGGGFCSIILFYAKLKHAFNWLTRQSTAELLWGEMIPCICDFLY